MLLKLTLDHPSRTPLASGRSLFSNRWHPVLPAAWVVFAACVLFLALWGSVLSGSRVLIGGDILYYVPPWAGSPLAHAPANGLLSDTILNTLPWQELVHQSWLSSHLPLWNPDSYGGVPLLANFQSAPFSLFTVLTLPFDPPYGESLSMLAKLWVAGGLAWRSLSARWEGAGRRRRLPVSHMAPPPS